MDAGRIRIEHEEVGLAEVARQVAEDFFALADASDHTLLLDVDEDAWAYADEERIQQIVRALTGNALVHTPAGHDGAAARRAAAATRVALAVEDNGPGIPAEHLERVFQRFYRVEGGQASGSGLGLAIARELAGRMGGTVTVARRPGWTVFTLELPAEGAAPARRRTAEGLDVRHAAFPRGNVARPRVAELHGYSDSVRAPVFAIAAVAAILGAGLALALGSLIGATDGDTTTVVVQSTLTEADAPAVGGARRSATASTRLRSTPAARRAS